MAADSQRAVTPLLEVRGVCKRFPGVRALHQVGLHCNAGEVLVVIGENGAGKSTLMKVLAGIESPDSGEILLEGRPVQIGSVRDARDLGIALIHQELKLADNLDVASNLFLGRELRRFGLISKARMVQEAAPLLRQIGLDCSPRRIVGDLSLGCQQMVEIAKAVATRARLLIMDEPTSSLSRHETENLHRVVRDLREQGVSIVYISHRLGEVREVADRVVVLRDGQNAGALGKADISHERMVKLMVGRDLAQFYQRAEHERGQPVLEVQGLRTPEHPAHELNFTVHSGEVVGLAGLVGAGRTELMRVLFGIQSPMGGRILLDGKRIIIENPLDAIRAGIALVPEDRKEQGVILEMAVRENITLAGLRFGERHGFLDHGKEVRTAAQMIGDLNIRTPGQEQLVQYLSGGNQQKVALAKWLTLRPRVLLLDEPTRGVDVGAKQEIYRLMEQLVEQGTAILCVSSEMEEVLGVSDRVLVMQEGRLAGELGRSELSEEAVMHLATAQ